MVVGQEPLLRACVHAHSSLQLSELDGELLEGRGWGPLPRVPLKARLLSNPFPFLVLLALQGTTFPRIPGSRLWLIPTSGSSNPSLENGKKVEVSVFLCLVLSLLFWGVLLFLGVVAVSPLIALPAMVQPCPASLASDNITLLLAPLCATWVVWAASCCC